MFFPMACQNINPFGSNIASKFYIVRMITNYVRAFKVNCIIIRRLQ